MWVQMGTLPGSRVPGGQSGTRYRYVAWELQELRTVRSKHANTTKQGVPQNTDLQIVSTTPPTKHQRHPFHHKVFFITTVQSTRHV